MTLTVNSLDDLAAAAIEIWRELKGRQNTSNVVAFFGEMGAGKTTLVGELMRAAGSTDEVTSPTFSLVNEYVTGDGESVFHFDFYRIEDLREAFDLGYEEYFYSGALCLVEWPEKVAELLPAAAQRLSIEVLPDGARKINLA